GLVPGIETTTGPLGQGFANGVGMAIAEKRLAALYNRPGYNIIDHYTYALVSDGDLQEGVSSEAASLAGTFQLGKLIYLYDDNKITIEGSTKINFTEDVALRFQAYGWQVIGPIDGMDTGSVDKAIKAAQEDNIRPSLIICRTVIGQGSPNKAGTASCHGEPLGEEEVKLTRQALSWSCDNTFLIPPEVTEHFQSAWERWKKRQQEWEALIDSYKKEYPGEAGQLFKDLSGDLPEGWDRDLEQLYSPADKPVSTREASGRILNAIAPRVNSLMGGSADLAPSTKTILKDQGHFGIDDYRGRNMHFGVREHAMGAISNGMSLHGGIIPYTATFFVFYDYMRPSVRLAALMGIRVIFIFTHDSIGLGEDGPTHQPIEHLMALRTVPGMVTVRPADATETVEAWKIAMERRQGPTALIFSRQNLPVLDRSELAPAAGVRRGAYILWQAAPTPDLIIIGTGSEVHTAVEAGKLLKEKGVNARVVSMPSWELFDSQSRDYRVEVLPPGITARISIEAGATIGWERYVGLSGTAIGIDRFGASAPYKTIFEKLGITSRRVVDEGLRLLEQK
ncbi:MAG: transketolase, partial [Dehalococcoidia bacterium]|nr:transketolase [Dehalococcoidia bacterium]